MSNNGTEQRQNSWTIFGWVFAFACRTLAASVEVFLHRRFGARYFGLQSAAVIPLILLFIAGWAEHNAKPLLVFLWLYVGMCVLARTGIVFRGRKWQGLHSRYNGQPWLAWCFPRWSEMTIKQHVEPALVLAASMIAFPNNEPLGAYLLCASFGLGATVTASREEARMRAQQMNDAFIDQQQVTERFRDLRGDRF